MDERTKRLGLQTFFRIMKAWGLNEGDGLRLLGLEHAPEASALTVDQLERISHTLAIFKALHTLLNETSADAWIQKANQAPLFGGGRALDLLRSGTQGFRDVRAYLIGQVGSFE
jgi:hypothetical protein